MVVSKDVEQFLNEAVAGQEEVPPWRRNHLISGAAILEPRAARTLLVEISRHLRVLLVDRGLGSSAIDVDGVRGLSAALSTGLAPVAAGEPETVARRKYFDLLVLFGATGSEAERRVATTSNPFELELLALLETACAARKQLDTVVASVSAPTPPPAGSPEKSRASRPSASGQLERPQRIRLVSERAIPTADDPWTTSTQPGLTRREAEELATALVRRSVASARRQASALAAACHKVATERSPLPADPRVTEAFILAAGHMRRANLNPSDPALPESYHLLPTDADVLAAAWADLCKSLTVLVEEAGGARASQFACFVGHRVAGLSTGNTLDLLTVAGFKVKANSVRGNTSLYENKLIKLSSISEAAGVSSAGVGGAVLPLR